MTGWGLRPQTPLGRGLSVALASRFYSRIVRASGGIACCILMHTLHPFGSPADNKFRLCSR